MIVWLASYPRSGNTYGRVLLKSLYGVTSLSRYELTGRTVDPVKVGLRVEMDHVAFTPRTLQQLAVDMPWQFIRNHHLPEGDVAPALYFLRDGRDAVVSYAHYALREKGMKQPPREQLLASMRNIILETRSPFGTWSANVQAWLKRPHTQVVRFEDMILRPEAEMQKALHALGFRLEQVASPKVSTFDELKNITPDFFRRGQVGSWKDEMPEDIQELFWKHNAEAMALAGYER